MVSKPAARKAGPQRRSKQHAAVSQDPPGREAQPQPSSSTAQTDRIPGRPTQNERSAGVHGSGKPSRGAEHVPQRSAGTNHRLTSAQGHERSADGALAVGPPRGKGKVGKSSQSAGQPLGPAGERLPSGGSPSRAVSGRPAQGASVPKEAPRARSKTTDQKERHLRQGQPPPQSQARPGQGQTRPGPDSSSSAAQSKGRRQMDPREKYLKKAQMVKAAKFKQEAPSAPNGCPAHKTEDRRTPEGSGDMLRSASAGSLGAEGEPRRPTDLRNPGDPRSPSRTKGVSEPRSQRSDKNTPKSATVGAAVGTRLQVHRNPESANVGANSSVRTTELENVENTEAISRVANVAAPGVSQQQQVKSPTIVPPEVKRTELRNPESIITGESSQDRLDNSGATVSAPIEPTPIEGNAVPSQTFPSEQEGGHSGCTGETDQGNLYQLEDNKRDIARITVNARAEVARIHVGLGAHSTEPSSSAEARTSGVLSAVNPLFSASRMAPAPPQSNSPASYNAVNGDSGSSRDAQGIVELSSLQLDIVSQGADNGGGSPEESPIQTHHINAGVGATRGESNQALPDILNSHILPPYTVRQNQHRASRQNNRNRINQQRAQRHGTPNPGLTQLEDAEKGCCNHECCLGCVTVVTTFRWVLVSLAMLGVCCVVTGIILGALHMTVGSSFLTLSLMFIGLGVMLVVVVGVGWKCTPPGHEPCHLLFNLGDHSTRDICRSVHRRHRDRSHWYGGVSYPEFRYRRPPPSYNASMQEYQHQLMLAQIQLNNHQGPQAANASASAPAAGGSAAGPSNDDNYSLPSSPPPTYKSHVSAVRPSLHITFPPQGEEYPNSGPPTYRSRVGTTDRPALNMNITMEPEEEVGVDNPACSEPTDPDSPAQNSEESVQPSGPESASSTLHRASLVVDYLNNVLDNHDHTLDHGATAEAPTEGEPVNEAPSTTESVEAPESVTQPSKDMRGVNSAETSTSVEETDRIRDTPL